MIYLEDYLITKEDEDRIIVDGRYVVDIHEDLIVEMIRKYNNLMLEICEKHSPSGLL